MIDFTKVITAADRVAAHFQGGGSHDRNMQALGLTSVALARTSTGDTITITHFRDAQNIMKELTPPQVMALWMGAVAAIEAFYGASWVLKDADIIPQIIPMINIGLLDA